MNNRYRARGALRVINRHSLLLRAGPRITTLQKQKSPNDRSLIEAHYLVPRRVVSIVPEKRRAANDESRTRAIKKALRMRENETFSQAHQLTPNAAFSAENGVLKMNFTRANHRTRVIWHRLEIY